MRNIYVLIFCVTFFSCSSQEKEKFVHNTFKFNNCLNSLKKSNPNGLEFFANELKKKKLYKPYEIRLDNASMKSMLSSFNNQLDTNIFNNICQINQISFSLGKQKYKNIITDTFYIQKWYFKDSSTVNKVLFQLNRIDKEVNLSYLFPKNWRWLKYQNNIYFVYTESYSIDSKEFKMIFKWLEKSLDNI